MPISTFLKAVREKVGHDLLMMTAVSISIFDADRRLLLGRDAEMAFWTLPGGAIDPNEQPADAAVRECFEETGLIVTLDALIGGLWRSRIPGSLSQWRRDLLHHGGVSWIDRRRFASARRRRILGAPIFQSIGMREPGDVALQSGDCQAGLRGRRATLFCAGEVGAGTDRLRARPCLSYRSRSLAADTFRHGRRLEQAWPRGRSNEQEPATCDSARDEHQLPRGMCGRCRRVLQLHLGRPRASGEPGHQALVWPSPTMPASTPATHRQPRGGQSGHSERLAMSSALRSRARS